MKRTYINGKIFTSNDDNLYAEAFTVEGGIITKIGKTSEVKTDDCGEIIDLEGKCAIPGFIDAHMHPVMLADYSKKISSLPPKINSIEELISEIKLIRQKQGEDQWIQGWGYDEGKLEEHRSPDRYDLDKGADDVPVSIVRTCGHIRCVNSKALELAGIDRNTPDPQGGEIDRDENGEPTGILKENARNLVTDVMPTQTEEKIVDELCDLGRILLSQGVVAVTDMGNLDSANVCECYDKAAKRGFKQEVAVYHFWEHYAANKEFALKKEDINKEQQVRTAGLKLIGDGSVSGRTAWMKEPYLDSDEYGISVCSDELLESAIDFCKRNKCQLSVHAMGGRTIRRMVNRLYEEENWMEDNTPYVRLEHITDPTEDSIVKAAEKGMAFATQPIFLYAEIESYLENLGIERTKKMYPFKHLLDKGVKLCFSTDAPATSWAVPSDPFPNIKSAVTRVAYDGTDCGKDQAVDVETAIKLYTKESAEVSGFEKIGQLKPGYKANFAVLSDDIFTMAKEDIDKVFVEKTYIKGEKVYEK